MSFSQLSAFRISLNSSLSSGKNWYVDRSSKVLVQVCATGLRAHPSSWVKFISHDWNNIRSEPVTKRKKVANIFEWRPLMYLFKYFRASLSPSLVGWQSMVLTTFEVVGISWLKKQINDSTVEKLLVNAVSIGLQHSVTYCGLWINSWWANSVTVFRIVLSVTALLQSKVLSNSIRFSSSGSNSPFEHFWMTLRLSWESYVMNDWFTEKARDDKCFRQMEWKIKRT